MGPSQPMPLSWLVIQHYAEAQAMDHESAIILHRVIRGLDADWLEEQRRRLDAAR